MTVISLVMTDITALSLISRYGFYELLCSLVHSPWELCLTVLTHKYIFFVKSFVTTVHRDTNVLLKCEGNFVEFTDVLKEHKPFPSSQIYPQTNKHINIPTNTSLQYKWFINSSVWIDWEFFVSNILFLIATEFVRLIVQIHHPWCIYNEIHTVSFSVQSDLKFKLTNLCSCSCQ